jgi:hypothetical protein
VGAVPALALTGILVRLLLFLYRCCFLCIAKYELILHATFTSSTILGLRRIFFNRNGSNSMGRDVWGTPRSLLFFDLRRRGAMYELKWTSNSRVIKCVCFIRIIIWFYLVKTWHKFFSNVTSCCRYFLSILKGRPEA